MRFIFFTRRDPKTDFRRALAQALREQGYDSYVVLVRRTLLVDGPTSNDQCAYTPFEFLRFLSTFTDDRETVIVNTLNLGDPIVCLALRLFFRRCVWIYDIHDYFLYDLHGWQRWLGWISLQIHLSISTLSIHAARTLKECFPKSLRLGNASHLQTRSLKVEDPNNILILASIDERFDFQLVRKILESSTAQFHIFGSLAEGSASATQKKVRVEFEALREEFPNLRYFGSYVVSDLEGILDRYQIMLAPYKAVDASTRYIEPLRYYHALNRGLEIISTSIPAASDFSEFIHLIGSASDFNAAVLRLSQGSAHCRNTFERYRAITWADRAGTLVTLARHFVELAPRR